MGEAELPEGTDRGPTTAPQTSTHTIIRSERTLMPIVQSNAGFYDNMRKIAIDRRNSGVFCRCSR